MTSPGDLVVRPDVVAAILLLLLNDWWAKAHWHNVLTGKLSDFAGLYFLPIVLVAAVDVVAATGTIGARPGPRVLASTIGVVGLGYLVIKGFTSVALGDHWLVRRDPTDLIAMGSLVLVWLRFGPELAARRWADLGTDR
jgi:hypothetical protein